MPTLLNVTEADLEFLKTMGYGTEKPKSPYEKVRYKGAATVILYTSGKCVVSGKDDVVRAVMGPLLEGGAEMVDKISFVSEEGWVIGSDESLKGDTFGGLIVAGVRADDKGRNALRLIGVEDSKKLKDSDIAEMAERIKAKVKYSIKVVSPQEYNQHSQTTLMNQLHAAVAKDLGSGTHVVDLYPGCRVGDVKTTKAEQKYLEVAAASILAREAGLAQLDELSLALGFQVPKGSTHVKEALAQLKASGKDPAKFVKMHFKNVQRSLGL